MPVGFDQKDMHKLDEIVTIRKKITQGDLLFENGETFTALFAIRT